MGRGSIQGYPSCATPGSREAHLQRVDPFMGLFCSFQIACKRLGVGPILFVLYSYSTWHNGVPNSGLGSEKLWSYK